MRAERGVALPLPRLRGQAVSDGYHLGAIAIVIFGIYGAAIVGTEILMWVVYWFKRRKP